MTRILMTGGTSGLGYAAAQRLLQRAPDLSLVVTGRDRYRTDGTARTLGRSAEALTLDLADPGSVQAAAQILLNKGEPISGLVANAGMQAAKAGVKRGDGVDLTFAANHLGHFQLIEALTPVLAPDVRIVFVASGTHDPAQKTGIPSPRFSRVEEIAWPETASGYEAKTAGLRAYATSKLCNILHMFALSRRLGERGLSRAACLAFDPGLMPGTGLARDYPALLRIVWHTILPRLPRALLRSAFGPNIQSPARSAAVLADLLLAPDWAGRQGIYVAEGKLIEPSALAQDENVQEDLWALSAKLTARGGEAAALGLTRIPAS